MRKEMNKANKNKENEKTNKNKMNIFKMLHKLVPLIFRMAPGMIAVCLIITVIHGTMWGVITMMQQRFFDEVASFIHKTSTMSGAIVALALLGISYIICHAMNGLGNYYSNMIMEIVNGKLSLKIHDKIAKLSPIQFEDTDKLDDINKAEQGKNNTVIFVFLFKDIIFFYLPYFAFMGCYLFFLKPTLIYSILLVFLPTLLTQIIRTKFFSKLEDETAPLRREFEHYDNCVTNREYYKETRLLGAFSYFKKLYQDTLDLITNMYQRVRTKTLIIEFVMRMVTVGGYCIIMLMLYQALMKGEITVGAFAAVFSSIGMLFGIMEEVVFWRIGDITNNYATICNYINFLDLKERKGSIDTPSEWGNITLEHVSFSYPGAENEAIKDACFTLKKGETLAIVGENGSGKSTLIRLITGLYLPDRGKVTMNGIDTKEFNNKALYENTSAVFQKYQRYQMTMEDNITISQKDKEYNEDVLTHVCEMSGINKNDDSFIDGFQTMLSKEFDGIDLSGGQWQRLAIARGFFRKHNLIVLDEPTAAIDPYEETRIYNRFAKISADKSAVIVTHRLGSVKLADRIIVMKDGSIEELGTHEELLKAGKEYTRLYEAQEQWYREEAAY